MLVDSWARRAPVPRQKAVSKLDALRGEAIAEVARWEDDEWKTFAVQGLTLMAMGQGLSHCHAAWEAPSSEPSLDVRAVKDFGEYAWARPGRGWGFGSNGNDNRRQRRTRARTCAGLNFIIRSRRDIIVNHVYVAKGTTVDGTSRRYRRGVRGTEEQGE